MYGKLLLILLPAVLAKSGIIDLDLLQYKNYTFADTDTVCNYFRNASNVTEKCLEQLEVVCENSTLLMTMLDASSKFPYSGLGFASKTDYGNYDQCLTISHKYEGGRILGEHCGVGLVIPDIGSTADDISYYSLAVCRPNGCSASDFNNIVTHLISQEFEIFVDGVCQTVETNTTFTAGDIVTLTIFAIVIVLMTMSTIYDSYLYKNKLKSRHPLFLAFSVLSNGRKLLHISKHSTSKEQIETFHGMRVISMMWIVAGHGMSVVLYMSVTNVERVQNWINHMSAFYMSAAHLAVDTFFFMSGFLLAFQYLKGRTRSLKAQVLSVPQMILHRYLRLTPAMLMVYLVMITIFVHLGSGPIWSALGEQLSVTCKNRWLPFFLYIQNYYNYEDMCLLTTWYLSADMQMFLMSPLILIPLSLQLKKWGFKIPMAELLILNLFWTILPLVTKLVFRNYTNEYDTHSRLINYFIGIMLGAFMRTNIEKPFLYMLKEKHRPFTNLIVWLAIILGMLAVVLCYQAVEMTGDYVRKAVFYSLMRPAWCIGLSWITYSCYHGHGGLVNWILCRPIFQVIGRLTYCIYLLHILVIMYYMASVRTRTYFTEYNAMYQFCGHYVVSVILAIFWTLAFESPLIIIEKYFLGGGTRPTIEHKETQNGNTERPNTDAVRY